MTNDRHLVAKAAVDALNSIRVMKGIVQWREPRSATRRWLDRLTGQQFQLDQVRDSHVANAFEQVKTLVEALRDQAAESDLVMLKAISTVKLLRDRTLHNEGELEKLSDEFKSFETEVRGKLTALQAEMDFTGSRGDVDEGMTKLLSQAGDSGLLLGDLVQLADTLWWGRFGAVIRADPAAEAAQRLVDYFLGRFTQTLADAGFGSVIELAPLIENIRVIPNEEIELAELVAMDPPWATRPLMKASLTRQMGQPDPEEELRRVPIVTPRQSLPKRILNEAIRSGGN